MEKQKLANMRPIWVALQLQFTAQTLQLQ